MPTDDTAYCISCGAKISADTNFCPECGSNQDPEKLETEETADADKNTEPVKNGGFTSWAIGFRPGRTGRNILVGLAYFFFYFVGIPLLIYAYLRKNPDKEEYFAYAGGGLMLFMALGAFAQGSLRGTVAGVIALLLGLFFLPVVRQKTGIGNVPGIDVDKSARRSVIVGTGYALGSMVLVGAAFPEVEDNDSSSSDGESSSDGSDGTGDQGEPSGTRWYDSGTKIGVVEGVEAEMDSIGNLYIRGTAENFSDTDYDYVQLTFEVYDGSDAKIADGLANTSGLSSGQRWRFEALAASADDADSYALTDITAY